MTAIFGSVAVAVLACSTGFRAVRSLSGPAQSGNWEFTPGPPVVPGTSPMMGGYSMMAMPMNPGGAMGAGMITGGAHDRRSLPLPHERFSQIGVPSAQAQTRGEVSATHKHRWFPSYASHASSLAHALANRICPRVGNKWDASVGSIVWKAVLFGRLRALPPAWTVPAALPPCVRYRAIVRSTLHNSADQTMDSFLARK